ncbi:hypothetical protein [Microbacterium sp. 179-I 3D3 NHS]|uniref:hypothetical protein n=1 Tax=Microbacterium sp. 179-I 3D3 NHS TaxID=3142382 RepID=UPI00399F7493
MITAALAPVNVDIVTSMVAVVTVLAALVLGLATLARPSRATIVWGTAFSLGVLGAYLWLAGHQMDRAVLRAAASGILLGFEPLVWLGLRFHLGRRAPVWLAVAFAVLVPCLLVLASGTVWYLPAFHVVFLGAGVFAALIAYELLRRQPVSLDVVLPLALASCGFVVVAVVTGVLAIISGGAGSEAQLAALRGMNAVGTVVVSTCAAFTLVLMVRAPHPSAGRADDAAQRAAQRLRKAEAQNELSWSILDIRLDDPADLREASTGSAYALIVKRFHQDIEEALPAAADAHRVGDARAIAIVRGGDEAVQHHIRDILNRISSLERDSSFDGIRASASIGWATVSTVGYDYDVLVAAAGEAAVRARADGGDRWKRATAADGPGVDAMPADGSSSARTTTLER